MNKPIATFHNAATGETVEREMTDDEYKVHLETQADNKPLESGSNE
jgi:hypothetical protein